MHEFTSEIGSPGMGVSPIKLSREPLATEAEATRGPDDQVDTEEIASADIGDRGDIPGLENFNPDTPELPPLAMDLPKW